MGNMLRHAYDEIDSKLTFNTIERQLPPLEKDCRAYLLANTDADE